MHPSANLIQGSLLGGIRLETEIILDSVQNKIALADSTVKIIPCGLDIRVIVCKVPLIQFSVCVCKSVHGIHIVCLDIRSNHAARTICCPKTGISSTFQRLNGFHVQESLVQRNAVRRHPVHIT